MKTLLLAAGLLVLSHPLHAQSCCVSGPWIMTNCDNRCSDGFERSHRWERDGSSQRMIMVGTAFSVRFNKPEWKYDLYFSDEKIGGFGSLTEAQRAGTARASDMYEMGVSIK